MGFTVSGLTNYVDQSSTELIAAAQFKSETAALANIQTGVKSSAALQILTVSPIPQDGSSCGFFASGDVAFTQRNIEAKSVKYEDSLCPKALEAKWTQILLRAGQNYTEADIPAMIMDEIVKSVNKRNETADWQGDTTSGSAYLKTYDGLIKIIDAASGVVDATASTFNSTNCRTIVGDIVSKIPAALKGDADVKVFMGYDAAEIYRQKLMNDNLYHVPAGSGSPLMAEGSVHQIVPVHGLDGLYSVSGQSCIFAMKPTNMYLGVDMQGEEEQARMWVDGSDMETVKYRVAFRRGWQIAIPSEVVSYANS